MTLTQLVPMLRTWEFDETIAFYTEVLGFRLVSMSQEWRWASLEKDGVSLMLSGPNSQQGDSSPSFTGSLYFRTPDVDSAWRELKDRVEVCYAPETFEYGMREFGIYDNNGYLLQFGQEQ